MYPIALLHCIITDIENHRLNKLLHLSTRGNIPRKTPILHVPAGGKVLIFYSEFNFSFFFFSADNTFPRIPCWCCIFP